MDGHAEDQQAICRVSWKDEMWRKRKDTVEVLEREPYHAMVGKNEGMCRRWSVLEEDRYCTVEEGGEYEEVAVMKGGEEEDVCSLMKWVGLEDWGGEVCDVRRKREVNLPRWRSQIHDALGKLSSMLMVMELRSFHVRHPQDRICPSEQDDTMVLSKLKRLAKFADTLGLSLAPLSSLSPSSSSSSSSLFLQPSQRSRSTDGDELCWLYEREGGECPVLDIDGSETLDKIQLRLKHIRRSIKRQEQRVTDRYSVLSVCTPEPNYLLFPMRTMTTTTKMKTELKTENLTDVNETQGTQKHPVDTYKVDEWTLLLAALKTHAGDYSSWSRRIQSGAQYIVTRTFGR